MYASVKFDLFIVTNQQLKGEIALDIPLYCSIKTEVPLNVEITTEVVKEVTL